jgi:hypothetical protein
MLRQEDIQYQQQHQDSQSQKHQQGQENEIYSTANVWLAGPRQKPTVQLPYDLAKKYKMHRPCRISFFDSDNGITMRFLHLNRRYSHNKDVEIES